MRQQLETHPDRDRAVYVAASHFMSSLPNNWSADRLFAAILADEDSLEDARNDQQSIRVWDAFDRFLEDHPFGKEQLVQMIELLALDLINFASAKS